MFLRNFVFGSAVLFVLVGIQAMLFPASAFASFGFPFSLTSPVQTVMEFYGTLNISIGIWYLASALTLDDSTLKSITKITLLSALPALYPTLRSLPLASGPIIFHIGFNTVAFYAVFLSK
jgi:hypothetical protein